MKRKLISPFSLAFSILTLLLSASSMAQQSTLVSNQNFMEFLEGKWHGKGEFSNGQKISANLHFRKNLDENWMEYIHEDVLPHSYKAISYWGLDGLGKFTAYTFDNGKGHRLFQSDGWKDNKLILINKVASGTNNYYENFTYKITNDNEFKMIYSVSPDGIEWRLIDFLVFKRA